VYDELARDYAGHYMKLEIEFVPRISRLCRKSVREVCEKISEFVDIKHKVKVKVFPVRFFKYHGQRCYALYCENKKQVEIAGHREVAESHEGFVYRIKNSIIHEMLHYGQQRDGIEINEKGIEVRARNIYFKMFPNDPIVRQYYETNN